MVAFSPGRSGTIGDGERPSGVEDSAVRFAALLVTVPLLSFMASASFKPRYRCQRIRALPLLVGCGGCPWDRPDEG